MSSSGANFCITPPRLPLLILALDTDGDVLPADDDVVSPVDADVGDLPLEGGSDVLGDVNDGAPVWAAKADADKAESDSAPLMGGLGL